MNNFLDGYTFSVNVSSNYINVLFFLILTIKIPITTSERFENSVAVLSNKII